MRLDKNWVRHVFFTLVEHGVIRVLDALTTLALIRVFAAEDFGLFSVYQSWVGILLLFLPSLEIVLYRNYAQIKEQGTLSQELGLYRNFNFVKIGIVGILGLLFSFVPVSHFSWTYRASLLFLAMALPLAQAFYGYLREPLRFEMKQDLVTMIGAAQRATVLGVLVLSSLFFSFEKIPKPVFVSILVLAVLFLFGWVWTKVSLVPEKVSLGESWPKILSLLKSSVLWIHFNAVVMQTVQTLDVFFMSARGMSIVELGHYSLALKAANFFQLVPLALVNSFGVYLGRTADQAKKKLVLKYFGLFVGMSLLLLGWGQLFGATFLEIIGRGKLTESNLAMVYEYFFWQVSGVLLLCASFPLSTYLGARDSLRALGLSVFVPWLGFSGLIYWFSSGLGILVTAKANLVVYLVLLGLLLYRFFSHDKK